MECPIHKERLIKVRGGISFVCPRCSYKAFDSKVYKEDAMAHHIGIPEAFAWTTWTLNGVEDNGSGVLVLSTGVTLGTAISPQIINVGRNTQHYWSCTKVKSKWTSTNGGGRIYIYASNDGGVAWSRFIKTQDVDYSLPAMNEVPQYRQSKYDDLRIKLEFSRALSGSATPTFTSMDVYFNKVKL